MHRPATILCALLFGAASVATAVGQPLSAAQQVTGHYKDAWSYVGWLHRLTQPAK